MDTSRRSALGGGIVLVLLGLGFLSGQLFPQLWAWVGPVTWPFIVIGVGAFLLVIGLVTGTPGMAVPACIVGGIGGLLLWQNTTGNWASWSYAWALIPGFAGLGTMLAGVLEGKSRMLRDGAVTVLVSLILFAIFASFLGGPAFLGKYWPVLLIALGLIGVGRHFLDDQR